MVLVINKCLAAKSAGFEALTLNNHQVHLTEEIREVC